MRKHFAVFLCLLTLLALPVGCAPEEDLPGSEVTDLIQTDETGTDSSVGAILPEAFSLAYLPGQTWDPITCQDGLQQTVASLLYESLFRLTPELEPELWLCSSYAYDPAACTYTFTLRSGISFSDGTPLTAEDVRLSLERACGSLRYGNRLSDVTAITAAGNTVTVTLAAPNTGFPALLDIPIVKAGTESDLIPVGTGPYLCSDAGGDLTLIANQLWWQGKNLPLERIALVETADPESLRYRLTSHDIQFLTADLIGTDPIPATGNIVYQDVNTTILQYIGLNTTRAPLNSAAFRNVLSQGLHREFLVNAFLSGHAIAAPFPISPVSSLYPTQLEQEYSLTGFVQAIAALDELPQTPLVFLVNEENSFKVSLASQLAANYSAQGILMEVRALPWEAYTAALQAGDFDLYYGEVKLTADWDLTDLLGTNGSLNYGRWSNPQTNLCLTAVLTSDDRAAAIEKLCSHLQQQSPILPLCFKRSSILMQSGVVTDLQSTYSNPFYGLPECNIQLKAPVSSDTAAPDA